MQTDDSQGGARRPRTNGPRGGRSAGVRTEGQRPGRRTSDAGADGRSTGAPVRGGARPTAPEIPEGVQPSDLDGAARQRLRTLSKENADGVARHLVMAGRLLDEDPETAYLHAQAAVRRAGRVDVVREAAGITAYRTGRYAEALRELRTVRRLNGSNEHLPLMADCERGLGRPDRALALAQEDGADTLSLELKAELALVLSGARLDLGDPDAALAVLAPYTSAAVSSELHGRVGEARASAYEAAGRTEEAREALLAATSERGQEIEEIVVFDLDEDDPAARGTEVAP